jgi:hypothetical protein
MILFLLANIHKYAKIFAFSPFPFIIRKMVECGKTIMLLWISTTVLSAIPPFYYSEPNTNPALSIGGRYTSSDPDLSLNKIIRIQGEIPIGMGKILDLKNGSILPSEAVRALQQLSSGLMNMMSRLGCFQSQPNGTLKLSYPLRIIFTVWGSRLPENPQPMTLHFPDDWHTSYIAIYPTNVKFFPNRDNADDQSKLATRSLPDPWITCTGNSSYKIIIVRSPWTVLTFFPKNPPEISIMLNIHPLQKISADQLEQLRSADSLNWKDIQNALASSADSLPGEAIFNLLTNKDEWRLIQSSSSFSFTHPESQIILSPPSPSQEDLEKLVHFKALIDEINTHNLSETERSKALEYLADLWQRVFPGIPMHLNLPPLRNIKETLKKNDDIANATTQQPKWSDNTPLDFNTPTTQEQHSNTTTPEPSNTTQKKPKQCNNKPGQHSSSNNYSEDKKLDNIPPSNSGKPAKIQSQRQAQIHEPPSKVTRIALMAIGTIWQATYKVCEDGNETEVKVQMQSPQSIKIMESIREIIETKNEKALSGLDLIKSNMSSLDLRALYKFFIGENYPNPTEKLLLQLGYMIIETNLLRVGKPDYRQILNTSSDSEILERIKEMMKDELAWIKSIKTIRDCNLNHNSSDDDGDNDNSDGENDEW